MSDAERDIIKLNPHIKNKLKSITLLYLLF